MQSFTSPRRLRCLLITLLVSPLTIGAAHALTHGREWRYYGGDPGGIRFSPLKQINRKNVNRLKKAWTYRTGEWGTQPSVAPVPVTSAFECTPLVVDGLLYLSTPSSRVIALDAETGAEVWKYDPQARDTRTKRRFQAHRGVAFWEGANVAGRGTSKRILFGTIDGELIALDALTGKPCPDFGTAGVVDLRAHGAARWPSTAANYSVTSPPLIIRDLVITGARVPEYPAQGPSGNVRAFDVRTGKLVWEFHTIPRPGEPGHETWEGDSWKDRTGVNVWSIMSADVERGLIFLPIGSPAYDFYGGDRKGKNLYANSLVALRAETGRLVWYYQTVHHDLWDYDPPAQPLLLTVRRNGREIPAVAQVTKMGFIFVLDRLTGKPLFPVEERPVPRSTVPGEAAWPTQPFPLKPPPLANLGPITRGDISTVTPESHSYCLKLFEQLRSGSIYSPPGPDLMLWMPGTLGGATWSGAALDPATGYLYVNTNEIGAVAAMKAQPAGAPVPYRRSSRFGEYARFWDENQWPCQRPPWGQLHAIDMNKGEIVWKVPLGIVEALEMKGVPQTGAPNLGGAIVTAGGLVFIAASNDSRFRAFNARTGGVLWVDRLEASGHATPVTFEGKKNGKQFVVIAAGGGGFFSKTGSDALVAYALP